MLNAPEESIRNFISLQYQPGNSRNIQVLCPRSELQHLFARIKEQWISVGDQEPYASVLSEEKYKRSNLQANLAEFHETGRAGLANLRQLCLKNDIPLPNGTLFELGCGVGRSTQYFSEAFDRVVGFDISQGNIRECNINLEAKNITNISLTLIEDLESYDRVPEHDVFFSEITIQHNPPPLQYFILDRIFQKLNPGAVFYFQTITHHATYSFDVGRYLDWQHDQVFEMHALPMRWVMRLLRKNGLFLIDVLKERQGGFNLDSHTFFGVRPG
jgi:2-polyprenyl-3-methyl-5-hydroxy-6-metoxy-1,4-benzoquinol methylase